MEKIWSICKVILAHRNNEAQNKILFQNYLIKQTYCSLKIITVLQIQHLSIKKFKIVHICSNYKKLENSTKLFKLNSIQYDKKW